MLKSSIALGIFIDTLERNVFDVLDELPDKGRAPLITAVSDLRIELNRIYIKLNKDETLAKSVLAMVGAAYVLAHHGAPSENALTFARRISTSAARRKRYPHHEGEELIKATIFTYTKGWDGHNATKLSKIIAESLKGSIGERTPRAILTRLNKLRPKQIQEV